MLQSAKDMHPTLIDHISAKIKDIILVLSQDGAFTKALQLKNDLWPKHNTKESVLKSVRSETRCGRIKVIALSELKFRPSTPQIT